jgi:hypothetical protein
METKFQTSFIPKRPIAAEQTAHTGPSVSLFMLISVILFIVSLAGAGFVIFWKDHLVTQKAQFQDTLTKNQQQFNPDLIEKLGKINTKIDLSKQLLGSHLAVSEIFNIVAQLTAEHVRFNSLDFSSPKSSKDQIIITMKGEGVSFNDIAFQSDVFGKSVQYGTNKVIINPILSDLGLNQNGNVSFTFTTNLDPKDILYTKVLQASLQNNAQSTNAIITQ